MLIRKHSYCSPVALDWVPPDDDDDDITALLEGLAQALPAPSDGRWLRCFDLEDLDHE